MNKITLQGILAMVTRRSELNLTKSSRMKEYVYARAVYFKLCREFTNFSFKEIGSLVEKDHASVMHGMKVFEMLEFHKDPTMNVYNECKTILTSVKQNLDINKQAGLYEDEEVEYWQTRYENMRDLYVNAAERLAKYDKEEVTTEN
jgi:hypothetical protein